MILTVKGYTVRTAFEDPRRFGFVSDEVARANRTNALPGRQSAIAGVQARRRSR
jgi:hypothetical protein